MVKIHGIVYIILSVGILFFSYKLDPQKFRIFIWIGYVFFAVGIGKLVFWFINKGKEGSGGRKEVKTHHHQANRGNIHPQRPAQGNIHGHQGAVRYCFGCGSRLIGHENFCSVCGQNLRV